MHPPSRYHYCGKKRRHATEAAALASGRWKRLHAYRCPKCRAWHLTSNRPKPVDAATVEMLKETL
jgi:hypothetical protein